MENFKYSLAKKGKTFCPACSKKTFVLYIDHSGNPLHSTVGKCDRADNCAHHYTPKQFFADNSISFDKTVPFQNSDVPRPMPPQPEPSYFDMDIVKRSLTAYNNNRLIQYLTGIIGVEAAIKAANHYYIGTSKHWDGATVFWQIDRLERVHAGKIMQYDPTTGKRVKQPVNRISWVHFVMKLTDFHLSQCLFGEHLLRDSTKPVAICESEKTALIASCYLPHFIWTACGGCGNLSLKLCEPLKGRDVILYPDAGRYDEWSLKAKQLSKICSITVSDLIEQNATDEERLNGFDLADYLIRFPLSDFSIQQPEFKSPEKRVFKQPDKPVTTPLLNYPKGQTLSFLDSTGQIYIPTKRQTYLVFQSIERLLSPSSLPSTVSQSQINTSQMTQIFINY